MRRIILLLAALIIGGLGYSQEWNWVQTAGGESFHNVSKAVCTDLKGNAIITGYHREALSLHQEALGNATVDLINFERKDNRMFVAKYGPQGELHWANYAKGYFAEGTEIITDAEGCIYLTGHMAGEMVFSSQDGNKHRFSAHQHGMMFLAKYSPTGRLIWLSKGGAYSAHSQGHSLAISNGQIFVVGESSLGAGETLNFHDADGGISRYSPVQVLAQDKAQVGFIAAYNTRGDLKGVHFLAGNQAEVSLSDIALDPQGNCYVSGLFAGRMSFKGQRWETEGFQTEGFCLSLSAKGNINWIARVKGKVQDEEGPKLSLTDRGLAMCYAGFGRTQFSGPYQGLETQSPENAHIGLVHLSKLGRILWHEYGAMGKGKVVAHDLAVDQEGGLYISGYYLGNLRIGSKMLNSTGFHRKNDPQLGSFEWWDKNAFVVRYHAEGWMDWVEASKSKEEEVAYGVALGPDKEIFLTGYFMRGEDSYLGDLAMRAVGKVNVFLARIDVTPVLFAQQNDAVMRSHQTSRTTVDKEEISVRSHQVVLSLWDNHQVDGDIISLYANDECILKDYQLNSSTKTLTLSLEAGEYRLRLHAENTGSIYPNTAAITIDDGELRQTVLLASDLNRSEAVKIQVK